MRGAPGPWLHATIRSYPPFSNFAVPPATMPDSTVKKFGADTAFGRPAQPVELAPLFVFLASNEARFVTGEVYGATGGKTPF
jgi:NAD(P)-dependent dehydrogenase (short-subunit alcohol dehydrogenase family)